MIRVPLSPARVIRLLLPVIAFLLLASIAGQVWRQGLGNRSFGWLVRQLNVNEEQNLPTAYQAATLIAAAALLALIAHREREQPRGKPLQWAGLSLLFLLLACDEAFRIHERLGRFRGHLPAGLDDAFESGWVMFGLIFVGIVGLAYAKFVFELPPRTRWRFVLAAALFVMGAAGMEIVAGSSAQATGPHPFRYQMVSTLEEAMEMTGVAVFLCALVGYLAAMPNPVLMLELRFAAAPQGLAEAPEEPAPATGEVGRLRPLQAASRS